MRGIVLHDKQGFDVCKEGLWDWARGNWADVTAFVFIVLSFNDYYVENVTDNLGGNLIKSSIFAVVNHNIFSYEE